MSIEISTDRTRLDIDWIVRQLQGSYWGGGYTPTQIAEAVSRSLCFGAYDGDRQVGFVRVVTDGAIFSSATDVIVQEDRRGQGIGSALMDAVVNHPEVAGTLCVLRARPAAQLWYFKGWDFKVIAREVGLMQRDPQ